MGIPTRDHTGVLQTALGLPAVERRLRETWPDAELDVGVTAASNIPRGRNALLGGFRERVTEDTAWMLWLDSDILVCDPARLGEYLARSLSSGVGFMGDYRMADGRSHMMKTRDLEDAPHYTPEELAELPDMAEIGMGGFGCLFIRQPMKYIFQAHVLGEDVIFFHDHPDLKVGYAKNLELRHLKSIWL